MSEITCAVFLILIGLVIMLLAGFGETDDDFDDDDSDY